MKTTPRSNIRSGAQTADSSRGNASSIHRATGHRSSRIVTLILAFLLATALLPAFSDDAQDEFETGLEAFQRESYKTAAEHFRKAADMGFPEAQYMLGWSYENGAGVEQDHAQAVNWFRKASDQGLPHAHFALGAHYVNGLGVEQDTEKGLKLIRLAADQGDETAQETLKELGGDFEFRMGALIVVLLFLPFFLLMLILAFRKKHRKGGFCPFCRGPVAADETACPACGAVVETPCNADPEAPLAQAVYRWAARGIDLAIEATIAACVLIVFGLGDLPDGLLAVISLPLALLLDTLVCAAFGSTLGKWLFGIRVVRMNSTFLSFREYLIRNARVYWSGLALGIPILNLIMMVIQQLRVSKGRPATYDEALNLKSIEFRKHPAKVFFGIVLFLGLIALHAWLIILGRYYS